MSKNETVAVNVGREGFGSAQTKGEHANFALFILISLGNGFVMFILKSEFGNIMQ